MVSQGLKLVKTNVFQYYTGLHYYQYYYQYYENYKISPLNLVHFWFIKSWCIQYSYIISNQRTMAQSLQVPKSLNKVYSEYIPRVSYNQKSPVIIITWSAQVYPLFCSAFIRHSKVRNIIAWLGTTLSSWAVNPL